MKELNFTSLLKNIHSEVETLRGIVHKVDEEGRTSVSGMEIFHSAQRDLQLCFLLFLAYTKSFDGDFPEDICDLEILLNKYFPDNKAGVLEICLMVIYNITHRKISLKKSGLKKYKSEKEEVITVNIRRNVSSILN